MIAIALVYAGLVALSLSLLLWGRLGLAPRAAMVAVVPALAFAVWQGSQAPKGWPTTAKPPDGAQLVYGVVREPEPGDPGEIDLWLLDAGANRPRAYRLPYSRQLHRELAEAAKSGGRVAVRRRKSGKETSRARFELYREPPAALPPKETR